MSNITAGQPPVPRVIGQSGIPLIVVGSGSIGNNGALTLTTALAATPAITNAYVYLPAGAIAVGVPAAPAWYYAVFSSTTAATIYNNTYTGGTPAIPASPTAFATTGPGAYTGSTDIVTAYSLSIPGNTIGINDSVRVSASFSYTNTASNKTLALSFGAFAIVSLTNTTTAAQTGIWGFKNAGTTGKQFATNITSASPLNATASALLSGTVDTTAAQTLSWLLTNAVPATNNLVLMNVTVELVPGAP